MCVGRCTDSTDVIADGNVLSIQRGEDVRGVPGACQRAHTLTHPSGEINYLGGERKRLGGEQRHRGGEGEQLGWGRP
jgi:hypothetical protein